MKSTLSAAKQGLMKAYSAISSLYRKEYTAELREAVAGCKSLLDVGYGSNSPVQALPRKILTLGIDSFPRSIEKSRRKGIHHKYRQMDIHDIAWEFPEGSFDCVLASDVIEHLEKRDALTLIAAMEKIARKRVIVFTPNGFLEQNEYEGNDGQLHKSGWTAREMRSLGYEVIGINGLKQLRGELSNIRYQPRLFWLLISDLSQPFVRDRPEHAFHLLCVKTIRHD